MKRIFFQVIPVTALTVLVLTVKSQTTPTDTVYHWNLTGQVLLFCDADTSNKSGVLVPKGVFLLYQNDSLIRTAEIKDGLFRITGIDSGRFEAYVVYPGHQIQRFYRFNMWHEFQRKNFILPCGFNDAFSGPGIYCPEGHRDEIHHVDYERMKRRIQSKLEKGEWKVLGETIEGCDPRYVCKEHGWLFR